MTKTRALLLGGVVGPPIFIVTFLIDHRRLDLDRRVRVPPLARLRYRSVMWALVA